MEATGFKQNNQQLYTPQSNTGMGLNPVLNSATTNGIISASVGSSTVQLRGAKASEPVLGESIIPYIKLHPDLKDLSETQKDTVIKKVISLYSGAVKESESHIGAIASKHADAIEATNLLVLRVREIVKAYVEVTMPKGINEKNSQSYVEMEVRRLLLKYCAGEANDKKSPKEKCNIDSGCVGRRNTLTMEKVLSEGTLREKMTFMYRANEVLLPLIFDDPKVVEAVNKKLESKGFQINEELLKKERIPVQRDKQGKITNEKEHRSQFYKLTPLVQGFRDRKERIDISKDKSEHAAPVKIGNIPGITVRELRAILDSDLLPQDFESTLEKVKNLDVTWIPGCNWFKVDPQSEFSKEATKLGGVPILSGPSGTTDRFLHGADYLGLQQDEKEKVVLALTGWMIPVQDHSYHEIREAAERYGIPYNRGPEAFDNVYGRDPKVSKDLKKELFKKGYALPSEYLSEQSTLEIAKMLEYTN